MSSRYKSRQHALQVLFQCDLRQQSPGEAIEAYRSTLYSEESEFPPEPDRFMEELAEGTAARREEIDRLIAQHSQHWRLERMPVVDRNILRLAVFEMLAVQTPPAIVIDQALELARRFSGEDSVPFVNGVLDAIRKSLQTKLEQAEAAGAGEGRDA
jgi:N utilization substance protein B